MRNVTLALHLYAAYREGHPQSPGDYIVIRDRDALSPEHHTHIVQDMLAIAKARFECESDEPEWAVEPGDDTHRISWPLDGMGGTLVLSSAPLSSDYA